MPTDPILSVADAEVDRLRLEIRLALRRAETELAGGPVYRALIGAAAVRAAAQLEALLIQAWQPVERAWESALRAMAIRVSQTAGDVELGRLGLRGAFGPAAANALAVQAAETQVATLVRQISLEQQLAIREAVARAMRGLQSAETTASHVRQVIGLTSRMDAALARARETLTAGGLRPAVVERQIARRRAVLLRERAETIARTETIRAASLGQEAAWKAAQANGRLSVVSVKRWSVTADDRLCPICAPYEGQTAPVGGLFPNGTAGPPAHPRCRCTMGLVRERRS